MTFDATTFPSTLISGDTQANEIADKIMALQQTISDLTNVPFDTTVNKAFFEFDDATGLLVSISFAGGPLESGLYIKDADADEEWMVAVDGNSEAESHLVIQRWDGSAWDPVCTISDTDIYHKNFASEGNSLIALIGDVIEGGGAMTILTEDTSGLTGGGEGFSFQLAIAGEGVRGAANAANLAPHIEQYSIDSEDIADDGVVGDNIVALAINADDKDHITAKSIAAAKIIGGTTSGYVLTSSGNNNCAFAAAASASGGGLVDYAIYDIVDPTLGQNLDGGENAVLADWSEATRYGSPSGSLISVSGTNSEYLKLARNGLWMVQVYGEITRPSQTAGQLGLELQHRSSNSVTDETFWAWSPMTIYTAGDYPSGVSLSVPVWRDSNDSNCLMVVYLRSKLGTVNQDVSRLRISAQFVGA